MLFNRFAYQRPSTRLAYCTRIGVVPTIVGRSGRVYIQGDVLQRYNQDHNLGVFRAASRNEPFVLKRLPRPLYNLSLRIADDFANSQRLRLHVDCNQDECILFYPYFKNTLLVLIQEDSDFPPAERKKILRSVGEAVQELHGKDWVHNDIKPDNILLNWNSNKEARKTVTEVVLGDFDIAFKSVGKKPRHNPYAVGNVMWRSPEGQTGRGLTEASDVYSFGLVCIYALGGGDFLLLNDYQELAKSGIHPEQEVLIRHFSYFGPAREGLLKRVDNEDWRHALEGASKVAENVVREQPELKFQRWGEELGPDAVDMISGMTNPDPTARPTMDQVLAHPWWQEGT